MIKIIRLLGLLGIAALFPVTSSVLAKECIDCHSDVLKQLKGNSHHIQGAGISGRHCYACHWEATIDGRINKQYHPGSVGKNAGRVKNSHVDLVVWSDGRRPTVYKLDETAVIFTPSDISTPGERATVATVTRHCLGCHSDRNNNVRPFEGDSRTPREYAWDGQSVASRYSHKGVAAWGKYSTVTTNKKQHITKAFSAHGNAAANQGGWSPSSGYDGDIPITRGSSGARNIECFDCHNSHGSMVSGVTSSYRTYDGSFNGGILKETQSGRGGYRMTYKPSVNLDAQGKNPYNAGAGLCFDCHETAREGTTPWGYDSTFGAGQPIMGYKDTPHFGPGHKGSTERYAYRQGRTSIVSSHLKAGRFLNYSVQGRITGLCTPCHDPHGVSRTLADRMPYAIPLLKGTWLTSPYREDGPPSNLPVRGNFPGQTNIVRAGKPREPMNGMKYFIDGNTFGGGRITEDAQTFGGICLKCHASLKSGGESMSGQIHRAVKGWGNNKEHSFPCSKCHQAHNSGLPSLLQTNCFVNGPPGLRENSGLPWTPDQAGEALTPPDKRQTTSVSNTGKVGKGEVIGCHVRQFGKSGTTSNMDKEDKKFKEVTAW